MMLRLLHAIGRNAPPVLAASIFAGLLFPSLATWCHPALVPSVYVLLAVSLLRLDWPAVARNVKRPGPALVAIVWLLLVSPFLVTALLRLVALPSALVTALVLMSASPPLISAVAFALIFGLDGALAIITLVVALLLVPFTLPPLALRLLGLHLEIGLGEFMTHLALLVGAPLVAAAVLRRLIGTARLARHAAAIDGLNVLVLVLFAIGVMAGVTDRIMADPGQVALWIMTAFAANLGLQLLACLAFLWLGRIRALTLAIASGNRNMALLIAVLADKANFDTMMYFALAQLPIYILPAALAPVYRRFREPARAGDGAGRAE